MSFLDPPGCWLLLGVAALLVAYVARAVRRRQAYAVRFTNLDLLDTVAPKRPGLAPPRPRRRLPRRAGGARRGLRPARPATNRVPASGPRSSWPSTPRCRWRPPTSRPPASRPPSRRPTTFVDILPAKINVGLVTFNGTPARCGCRRPPTATPCATAIDNLELGERTAIGEAIFASLDAIAIGARRRRGQQPRPGPHRADVRRQDHHGPPRRTGRRRRPPTSRRARSRPSPSAPTTARSRSPRQPASDPRPGRPRPRSRPSPSRPAASSSPPPAERARATSTPTSARPSATRPTTRGHRPGSSPGLVLLMVGRRPDPRLVQPPAVSVRRADRRAAAARGPRFPSTATDATPSIVPRRSRPEALRSSQPAIEPPIGRSTHRLRPGRVRLSWRRPAR